MSFNIKDFWDNKILEWECGRYNLNTSKNKPLEMIPDLVSKSLRFRLKITKELLKPHIKGKAIIEIGCGSGLLTKFLHDNGAKYYQGFDISENAINKRKNLLNPRSMIKSQIKSRFSAKFKGFGGWGDIRDRRVCLHYFRFLD